MSRRLATVALLAAFLAGCWLTPQEVDDKIAQDTDEVETADTGVPADR